MKKLFTVITIVSLLLGIASLSEAATRRRQVFVGDTEPTSCVLGDGWVDTSSTPEMKVCTSVTPITFVDVDSAETDPIYTAWDKDYDDLTNKADYTDISTADSATDITGAELEELSDGSQTTLHSHAGGSGGATTDYGTYVSPTDPTDDFSVSGNLTTSVLWASAMVYDTNNFIDFSVDNEIMFYAGGLAYALFSNVDSTIYLNLDLDDIDVWINNTFWDLGNDSVQFQETDVNMFGDLSVTNDLTVGSLISAPNLSAPTIETVSLISAYDGLDTMIHMQTDAMMNMYCGGGDPHLTFLSQSGNGTVLVNYLDDRITFAANGFYVAPEYAGYQAQFSGDVSIFDKSLSVSKDLTVNDTFFVTDIKPAIDDDNGIMFYVNGTAILSIYDEDNSGHPTVAINGEQEDVDCFINKTTWDFGNSTVTFEEDIIAENDMTVEGNLSVAENLTVVGELFTHGDIKRSSYLTLNGNQSTGITAGDEIHFIEVSGNLPVNATTHRVTLYGNGEKTYKLQAGVLMSPDATDNSYVRYSFYDVTNSRFFGTHGLCQNIRRASHVGDDGFGAFAEITPASDINVEVRIVVIADVSYLYDLFTTWYIETTN